MNANIERKTPAYPQSADEWREAIFRGLGLTPKEGKARYQAGTFPYSSLEAWLQQEFSAKKGYSPDFVPALLRNQKGLVNWVYGNGTEPYWPGKDEE